jgi:hypothetical protein
MSPSGVSGTIPTHSLTDVRGWVHPYTAEERCLSEEVVVGEVTLQDCDDCGFCGGICFSHKISRSPFFLN